MVRRAIRPAVAFLVALLLQACVTWRPVDVDPAALIVQETPTRVRVTISDGSRVVVQRPSVWRDSIVTMEEHCTWSPAVPGGRQCQERIGDAEVALDDVTGVEVRRVSVLRSAGLVASVPLTVIALYFLGWAMASDDCCSATPR